MIRKWYFYTSLVVMFSLLLGGCGFIFNKNSKKDDSYIPVQDYSGKEFSFNYDKGDKFGKEHRKEIVDQVNKYFKKNYGIEVTTHKIVMYKFGMLAIVESKQEPYFHTEITIGVDLRNKKVTGYNFSSGGDVQGAIMTGLYAMAYEKEFKKLDEFCEKITQKYPVIGMRQDAINNTSRTGYSTPFYYTSALSDFFPKAYNAYMKDHNIQKRKLRNLIYNQKFDGNFDPENDTVLITLNFFMKKRNSPPDEKLANQIIKEFKQTKGLPPGEYAIFTNSNEVIKTVGDAVSYEGTTPSIDDILIKLYK